MLGSTSNNDYDHLWTNEWAPTNNLHTSIGFLSCPSDGIPTKGHEGLVHTGEKVKGKPQFLLATLSRVCFVSLILTCWLLKEWSSLFWCAQIQCSNVSVIQSDWLCVPRMNHNHLIEVPKEKGNCQLLINQITFPSDRAGSEHSWLWIDFESKNGKTLETLSFLQWLFQGRPLVSNYLHCLAWCHSTPPSWLPTSLFTEDKMKRRSAGALAWEG